MYKNIEIEDKANSLLEKFSIKHPPIPVEDIVLGIGLAIQEENFGESVSGFLISKNNNNVIGINKSEMPQRKKFTIAHELGHFLLHSNKTDDLFISKMHFRNEASSTGELRKEREANLFAASLLMPKSFIQREIEREIQKKGKEINVELLIAKLSERFDVSQVAMTYRLTNLNFIF